MQESIVRDDFKIDRVVHYPTNRALQYNSLPSWKRPVSNDRKACEYLRKRVCRGPMLPVLLLFRSQPCLSTKFAQVCQHSCSFQQPEGSHPRCHTGGVSVGHACRRGRYLARGPFGSLPADRITPDKIPNVLRTPVLRHEPEASAEAGSRFGSRERKPARELDHLWP